MSSITSESSIDSLSRQSLLGWGGRGGGRSGGRGGEDRGTGGRGDDGGTAGGGGEDDWGIGGGRRCWATRDEIILMY